MKVLSLVNLLSIQNKNILDIYKNDELLVVSPLYDENLKNAKFIKCEIGAINYVLALVCKFVYEKKNIQSSYFGDLDDGLISGESNVGEEEVEIILEFLDNCDTILIDESLKFHKDSKNIETFLAILQEIYLLKIINLNQEIITPIKHNLSELKEQDDFNGSVVFKYICDEFKGGNYFAISAKIKDAQKVKIQTKNQTYEKTFKLDPNIKGTIGFLGVDKIDDYCYEVVKISKVC